jgi:organic radical activating enzyme
MVMKKHSDIIWLKNEKGDVQNHPTNIDNVKELVNSVGPGYCLAKFSQVTLHLKTGLVHSCHHPKTHSIPIEEIQKDPKALFNTSTLKQARKEMLEGQRPSECDYCWRIEDNNGPSDRFFKSLEPWALHKHDSIIAQGHDHDYYPDYLEVDFSNVCNLKCSYCGPEFSTKWVEDIEQNGPLIVLDGTDKVQWVQGWQPNLKTLAIKNSEYNPYLDAFWKWFPEAYKHLKVYRITGGEPLLSKETFRSIDWFIENPNTDLEFSINSNLSIPDKLWDMFVEKITKLVRTNSVKRVTVFTSVDAWGKRAEYIREGLDFDLLTKRVEQLLEIGNIKVTVMCTFNLLSITSIKELFEWQLNLKRKYNTSSQLEHWERKLNVSLADTGKSFIERKEANPSNFSVVGIDTPYLRHPNMLDAQYITPELVAKFLVPALNFVAQHTATHVWNSHQGFEDYELEKFKRVCLQIMSFATDTKNSSLVSENRAKFFDFVNAIDQRNGKSFADVFPELAEFYELCKLEREKFLT